MQNQVHNLHLLALRNGLVDWVQNRLGDVEIIAQGDPSHGWFPTYGVDLKTG